MSVTLGDIARRFDLKLNGDADTPVQGVCSLAPGEPGHLAYLADDKQAGHLADSCAAAFILAPAHAGAAPGPALLTDNPKLAFARVASLFDAPRPPAGVHESAIVGEGARIADTASIGARVVIGRNVEIEQGACLYPGVVINDDCVVGADSVVGPNVVFRQKVRTGARCRIGSGTVLGERGFGLAQDAGRWVAIPQLGGVRLADDVEIGANCTIDCGALGDTVIEEGAKLDDQIHIAHNCRIGAHTVIAGCSGVAGSTDIGAHCVIGGGVGVADHVTIVDGVIVTGGAQVHSSIRKPGMYSSQFRVMPHREWFKRLVHFRNIGKMDARIRKLEQQAASGGREKQAKGD